MNARDYLTVLRERKLLILGCVLACLVLAGGLTALIPKTYESSVSFYVVADPRAPQTRLNPGSDLFAGAQLAQARIESYKELVVGPRVAQDAATALGGGVSAADVRAKLGASSPEDTVVLTVTATDSSPAGAVDVLKAVSTSFIRLVEQLETPPGGEDPAVRVQLLQQPTKASSPVAPQLSLNLFIGFLAGLVIGFGLAIARRSMDVSVRSPEELEVATEAAVLGVVPEDASGAGRLGSGPRAEAVRRIRTNLEFSNVDGTCRVIVVTSALADEGKTTVACDLAGALAAVGHKVVMVNGDLRRPPPPAVPGLGKPIGLTTVLTGRVELYRAVQRQAMDGVDILASGRHPPRPNELLSSDRAGKVIDELKVRYDFVIVDAPPVLPVADAMNLGIHADGAIVVCRWGKTGKHQVASAVSSLRSVSIPIVGTILSRAPKRAGARWSDESYSDEELEEPIASSAPEESGDGDGRPNDGRHRRRPGPAEGNGELPTTRNRATDRPPRA